MSASDGIKKYLVNHPNSFGGNIKDWKRGPKTTDSETGIITRTFNNINTGQKVTVLELPAGTHIIPSFGQSPVFTFTETAAKTINTNREPFETTIETDEKRIAAAEKMETLLIRYDDRKIDYSDMYDQMDDLLSTAGEAWKNRIYVGISTEENDFNTDEPIEIYFCPKAYFEKNKYIFDMNFPMTFKLDAEHGSDNKWYVTDASLTPAQIIDALTAEGFVFDAKFQECAHDEHVNLVPQKPAGGTTPAPTPE